MNDDHTILNHYNLSNLYPTVWPADKEWVNSSSDEEETVDSSKKNVRRSRSRYSALQPHDGGRKSLVPDSEKLAHGQENLVPQDEPDALGVSDSVVRILRQRGLPVEEDTKLRNRFLLSSTTFSPNLFLSQVHSQASIERLFQGLDNLARSIDSKSASLKVLVESNFERFVRAKTTIDNVYSEMRNHGSEPEEKVPRGHSRIHSRESRHFRNISSDGPHSPGFGFKRPSGNESRKNALTKDSEYGVQGIRHPLIDLTVKAEEIWGPALGGQEREESLKVMKKSLEEGEPIIRVARDVDDCIRRRDYEGLVEEFNKALKHVNHARDTAEATYRSGQQLTEPQIHQIVITSKMWSEVDTRVAGFKKEVWRRLTSHQIMAQASMNKDSAEDHLPLVNVLLELGVEENPMWVWLLSRYDYLKQKINATFERSRVEVEVLRRRLANADRSSPVVRASYLRTLPKHGLEQTSRKIDAPAILELWDLLSDAVNYLLSTKQGVLKEVIDFWGKAQAFAEGKMSKPPSTAANSRNLKHRDTSVEQSQHLSNIVIELISLLQEHITSFFSDPPIEDVSSLYSPSPNTATPMSPRSPGSAFSPYARQDSRFLFDAQHPPPASPRKGEPWESFAFWPPNSNCLSGAHYLEKLLATVGSAASEMAALPPVATTQTLPEKLKAMVATARERSVRAVCMAWSSNAEICRFLEDWSRDKEHQDLTRMPQHFIAFEGSVLSSMQKLLYVPDASHARSGSTVMVTPPSAKLVQTVRAQFVSSLYKALSGMVENAEKAMPTPILEAILEQEAQNTPEKTNVARSLANDRNIRHLLTLTNLKLLQNEMVPSLINQFEVHFSITLTNEAKQFRDALVQISDRLFLSYAKPITSRISDIIHKGIASPAWVPYASRPNEVRPYVHEALLELVHTHAEVSTTTPGPLVSQVLSYLLEQMSDSFLDAFKQRDRYLLPALMQATLDMEFVAQTMSQYTTKVTSETQSKIYVELDEKTTQEASKQLQAELPEMRTVLKRLREGSKNEFLCFRRERGRAVSRAE